jgi:hypothetical protein
MTGRLFLMTDHTMYKRLYVYAGVTRREGLPRQLVSPAVHDRNVNEDNEKTCQFKEENVKVTQLFDSGSNKSGTCLMTRHLKFEGHQRRQSTLQINENSLSTKGSFTSWSQSHHTQHYTHSKHTHHHFVVHTKPLNRGLII